MEPMQIREKYFLGIASREDGAWSEERARDQSNTRCHLCWQLIHHPWENKCESTAEKQDTIQAMGETRLQDTDGRAEDNDEYGYDCAFCMKH